MTSGGPHYAQFAGKLIIVAATVSLLVTAGFTQIESCQQGSQLF